MKRVAIAVLLAAPVGGCLGPTGPDAVREEPPTPNASSSTGDRSTSRATASRSSAPGSTAPIGSPRSDSSPATVAPERTAPPPTEHASPAPSPAFRSEETSAGAPPADASSTRLRVDSGPARALLAARADTTWSAALVRSVELLAYCADADRDDVEDELVRALRGEAESDAYFTFHLARAEPDAAARGIDQIERVLRVRRDAIESRVRRLLPDEPPDGPTLAVVIVLGMPVETPIGIAPAPEDDASRVMVVDARLVGGRSDDALGEELSRRLTPELFHLRFEAEIGAGVATIEDGLAGMFAVALNEGTGEWLGLAPELRYDDQGRRTPDADLRARRAMRRFEENLARLLDDETSAEDRASLEWTFFNGEDDERWGTHAAALMIDAIDRFDEPGRMRRVLSEGPAALVEAYAALGGRHATVPPISLDTRERVARVVAERDS